MKFSIKPGDTFIWNLPELIGFLAANQHTDIVIQNGTEGCCSTAIGLYQWLDKFQFQSVTIETSNVLETHPVHKIKYVLPWKFVEVQQPIEQHLHDWNKKAVFGTVYGRASWHRLGLAAHLLSQHSTISQVGFVADPNNVNSREFFELEQLWQHSPASVIKFAQIQHLLPLIHPGVEQYVPASTWTDGFVAQTKSVYPDFLIDVVAETFTTGRCFFVTEKTVRPMLLKKPFLLFGSRDYLAYLRQMGFRTFGDFWDETYDGYSGAERLHRMFDLIDQLAKKSKDELETMYWDMAYTLEHNYNLLMSNTFTRDIKEII